MKNLLTRFKLLPFLGLLALVLIACAPGLGQSSGESTIAAAETAEKEQSGQIELSSDLTDLNSIEEFQVIFNQDEDKVRLILLLSPT